MLSQAAILGHIEYVKWGLMNDPDAADEPRKRALIANEISDLFPQLKSSREPAEETPATTDGPVDASSGYVTCSYDLTIWQRHLVFCFLGWAGLRYPFHPDRFGIAVEQFLKHGAPPDFLVAVDDLETPKSVILYFDGTVRPLRMEMNEEFESALEHLLRGGRSIMSLREWIEIVNPKNKGSLVGLIDDAVDHSSDVSRCTVMNKLNAQLPFRHIGRSGILYILLPCLMLAIGMRLAWSGWVDKKANCDLDL
ncbi:hypothetical protein FGRMN_4378 [Fusarium graminum]|nr:hypothetical protein FGRMN_4378 [Fusarium graminum]